MKYVNYKFKIDGTYKYFYKTWKNKDKINRSSTVLQKIKMKSKNCLKAKSIGLATFKDLNLLDEMNAS